MDVFQWIIIPLAFGLIGFIEPCSVGANLVFLSYMNKMENTKWAWLEAIKFTLSRSLFLGSIGLATAYLGQQLFSLQNVYNLILGASFMCLAFFIFCENKWSYAGLS